MLLATGVSGERLGRSRSKSGKRKRSQALRKLSKESNKKEIQLNEDVNEDKTKMETVK